MTWEQFSEVFAMLALQLRATDADEVMGRAYFAVLKDLEPEFVAEAATRMAKAGGAVEGENRHWFPKTSEWRVAAAAVERDKYVQHHATLRQRMKAGLPPLCVACQDTGWCDAATATRFRRCDCAKLRRLEILGRRPWPALPEAQAS